MDRRVFCKTAVLGTAAGWLPATAAAGVPAAVPAALGTGPAAARQLLDMVHPNPGEPFPSTAFLDPRQLAAAGYGAQVLFCDLEGVPTFDAIAPDLLPAGSAARQWAEATAGTVAQRIAAAKAAGLQAYGWFQCLVLPKALVARYRAEICDARGRIDVERPTTQRLLAAQLHELFERFPELDGVVVRTGEIYLYGMPHHTASGHAEAGPRQEGTAIIRGQHSHRALIALLREQVCVQRDRRAFYRTWDFGNNFHTNLRYYLELTDSIAPHPQLVFSIKHTAGDFHQLTPFNPTLATGRHRQLVEVQCQREGYGKGAYPYYVGQGVIEGWEEYAWLMKPGVPQGLRDVIGDARCAGVWTWSRGGGWDGPIVGNEFWCALNALVLAHYTRDPALGEAAAFAAAARALGVDAAQLPTFRELCLLSPHAVLRGQLTALGANIDVWWARDDKLTAPDLSDFLNKGLLEEAMAEKAEAVASWRRIEALAARLTLRDAADTAFVRVSASYGRHKHTVIQHAWSILLLGQQGDQVGDYDAPRLRTALAAYDRAWAEWRRFAAAHADCPSLSHDYGFDKAAGLGAAVARYRAALG